MNMKTLMDHIAEENVEHRKCGFLTDMYSNLPCQLGTLRSESFSERIISATNLLIDAHHIRLHHENID